MKSNGTTTHAEYTIEVSTTPDFQPANSYYLIPVGGVGVTQARLRACVEGSDDSQFYRLVRREVTTTAWEPE